jgi:predicted enzyme related to lactoylglutathione lyase
MQEQVMSKIATLVLRVCDPIAQRRFYCEILGMREFGDQDIGYTEEEANIRFLPAETPYKPKPSDLYWKIALGVPNIELACQQLAERGIEVSAPTQFQDVGYLAKFIDPEGFTIELIEHWFKGNRQEEKIDPALLGGGAHFNLITLRAVDIEPIQKACADWGMVALSIQPVDSHGFTLYFFAFTSQRPPSSDLTSVKNREWLYQRRYTLLEVQHLDAVDTITYPENSSAGYGGTVLSGMTTAIENNDLMMQVQND